MHYLTPQSIQGTESTDTRYRTPICSSVEKCCLKREVIIYSAHAYVKCCVLLAMLPWYCELIFLMFKHSLLNYKAMV